MPTYTFSAVVTISIYTKVEADTEGEALEIAEQRGLQGLCYHCSGQRADEEWSTSGELDGEPQDIRLDN